MSYRDVPYPADLDWAAVRDLLKVREDHKLAVKAGSHLGLYAIGLVVGEPETAPRLGLSAPLEVAWAAVDASEPFTLIEAEQRIAEPKPILGSFGGAIAMVRLLKTLKEHAPEVFAFVKSVIDKARSR